MGDAGILNFLLTKPSAIMPKTDPKELHFPTWGEVSKYGINMLRAGDTVKAHFHDCNEFWIIVQGKGIATSGNVTYKLGPGDMLITRAGDEHSMAVIESMIAVYFHGVMPPDGRFGYLYPGIDLVFAEWQRRKKSASRSHERKSLASKE
jgi:mannose-6-phosphate isomerase-like protein (cupin superfamily)